MPITSSFFLFCSVLFWKDTAQMQKLLKGVNGLVSFAAAFLQKFGSARQTHKFDFIFFTLRKFLLCRNCEFWFNDYGL